MSKIIKINENTVCIGTNDGKIKEVRNEDINFTPAIGDEVDIFETENDIIVTKREVKSNSNLQSGININVSNNQSGAQPVYLANNTKAVNKIVYCILAFLLGGIGIHKFYAGKTSSGILYLLFFWTGIPMFVSFIELIVALCKHADSNGNILV